MSPARAVGLHGVPTRHARPRRTSITTDLELRVALAPQMGGDTSGQLRDRFGIVRMADVSGAPAGA